MSAADRILNMVVRGVVRAWTAAERGFNTLTVSLMADEPSGVHHLQPYGFAAVPPAGTDALVFQPSGDANHLIAIAAGRGPSLEEKESAVWNGFGWAVKLLEDAVQIDKDDGTPVLKMTETRVDLGGTAGAAVVRDGDQVVFDSATLTWLNAVAVAAGYLTPLASGTGTAFATSDKVFAE